MDTRIAQAVAGDRAALAELLYEHYVRIHTLLSWRIPAALRPICDVEDVLQQVWLAAFESIGGFQPRSDAAFAGWLESIAEHQLINAIRAVKSKKRGGEYRRISDRQRDGATSAAGLFDRLAGSGASPSRNAARNENIRALQIHLAGLPEDYRQAILLRDIEGLSREEVARRMGRTPNEVRGLLYRGRKKLRAALGNSSLYFTRT